ncbi:MBL fold metallo-hydrolase [Streptomyces flavofungini]|uniref:MBL fold metallo-hydrolase n=1 Tax=Streptomyces flavofungini TaxID=68200 RepID=A0ABS0X0Y8_9ACTN|nr:MBL fold metallo-hydrolase [Streptomyces flavofungini]MBJ3806826.1 MBL fold metallo-hydrolase [Streptomyces flavofungini]GHC60290.1 MBL fold metallo-hydrolase [Streptomyces flavofungini]
MEQRFMLGDVEVVRVEELRGRFGSGRVLVPDCPAEVWDAHRDWLAPDFWEPEDDQVVGVVQTWVLRSEGRTVLVDTGVGNGRRRPGSPHFDRLETDFLGRLAAVGVRPEDVDVVVNTHLHGDHVGWNTRAEGAGGAGGAGGAEGAGTAGGAVGADGGDWAPTFPNASYLMPAADYAYFSPEGDAARPAPRDDAGRARREEHRNIFADSVAPIRRAGQAVLWEGAHRIDGHLTLEPAPGHTPGSSVLRLASGSDRAVFVGDLLHTPVQILEPECSSCLCEDPKAAAVSRRRVLERAADEGELLVPAHFGGSGVAEVRRDSGKFAVRGWGV